MSNNFLPEAALDGVTGDLQVRLEREGLELVNFVAVPSASDRMVRFRTIQEVLAEFDDKDGNEGQTYVLHIRKNRAEAAVAAETQDSTSVGDAIYLANGKLNSEYLADNAKILFYAGDYSAARMIYATLAKSGERTAEALIGLAQCLEAEGRTEEALKAYDDSVLYYPSIESYRKYAALLIRQQKDQQAAEIIERALLLKELSEKARYELHQAAGNAWLRANLPAKAERHYRRALERNPHSDAVAANLGNLCLQQQRYDEAKIAFDEAIRVNPKNERAWFGSGSIHLALGNKSEALEAFAHSLEVKIQQPQAIFHLVKCAYETKNFARAKDLLKCYVDVSPFNPHLLYSLAGLEFHLGERTAAARTARMILQIQPAHVEAAALLKLIEN